MAKYITIDASAEASFDYATYLADYFAPTATLASSSTWLDTGAPTQFMGMPFYYPADEYGVRWNAAPNDRQILVEGEKMGYDVAGFHTYYGAVDAIRFATYDAGTQFLTDGEGRSRMFGAIEGLVVKGLDIEVAMAKNEKQAEALASNAFYDLYNWLRHANGTEADGVYIEKLYELFASKAQKFVGTAGEDTYVGTKFADKIDGGAGVDTLTGGKGKDVFIFDLGDSGNTVETADTILDFNVKQDRIDLRLIDANTTKDGDQAFKFLGDGEFTGKAGQANFAIVDGNTHVSLDIDGDSVADMLIVLTGEKALTADSFLL